MPLAHALRNGELALFANEAKTEGTTRVCCISDTHLVHDQLVLPEADVLVHAGDVMTESLLRHVTDKGEVKSQGEALFVKFAGRVECLALFRTYALLQNGFVHSRTASKC